MPGRTGSRAADLRRPQPRRTDIDIHPSDWRRPVPIYAIHYTYPDDASEMLTIRPEHREWLSGLSGLLVAGMYQDGTDEVSEGEPTDQEPVNAALIVCSGDSLESVTATFGQDPYWLGGHILGRVARRWDPPLGPWVADPTNSPG